MPEFVFTCAELDQRVKDLRASAANLLDQEDRDDYEKSAKDLEKSIKSGECRGTVSHEGGAMQYVFTCAELVRRAQDLRRQAAAGATVGLSDEDVESLNKSADDLESDASERRCI